MSRKIYDDLGASDQAAKGPQFLAAWKAMIDLQYPRKNTKMAKNAKAK